jgi:hypothetical protein
MEMPTASPRENEPSSWKKIAAVTVVLVALITVFLLAFALPNIHSKPRHVPVAVVATEAMATMITTALDKASPDGFDVTVVEEADQARDLILDRSVYGAFIVDRSGGTVLTASAASYAVSTTLATIAQQMGQAASLSMRVEDVVPLSKDDPRGYGLSAGALPIALCGWIAAIAIISLVRGTSRRLITASAFALLGGFALTALLQYGLGTFTGSYWLTALGAVLGIAATCFLVLGLQRLLKWAGLAIAAIILILLGNPLSGLSNAPELLPAPWGEIGQFLPPGAIGTLLRNTAFFDGTATLKPVIALVIWFLAGLGMYLLASFRSEHVHRSASD